MHWIGWWCIILKVVVVLVVVGQERGFVVVVSSLPSSSPRPSSSASETATATATASASTTIFQRQQRGGAFGLLSSTSSLSLSRENTNHINNDYKGQQRIPFRWGEKYGSICGRRKENRRRRKDRSSLLLLLKKDGGDFAIDPNSEQGGGGADGDAILAAFALSVAYGTVMGAKCALPSVLPLLTSALPLGLTFPTASSTFSPQDGMAQLLFASTAAIALGKVLLGPAIDYYGGTKSLQAILVLLSMLFGCLAMNQSFFPGFFVAWLAVDFVFSAGWAACLRTIHDCFPPDVWSRQIGTLAIGARTGNAVAFLCFAQILRYFGRSAQQPWRHVFAVCAVAQSIPLSLLVLVDRRLTSRRRLRAQQTQQQQTQQQTQQHQKQLKSKKDEKNDSHSSLSATWTVACREARKVDFWLHGISRSVLMVFASFLLFVPTVMTQIYRTSAAVASQAGSAYAFGCLVAMIMASSSSSSSNLPTPGGSRRRRRRYQKIWVYGGLLLAAALSSAAHLAHVSQKLVLSPTAACVSFFIWGASMSIPFYIPASLYALKNGGTECAATIADLFDIGGFALLASFNGYVAGLTSSTSSNLLATASTQWIPTFVMTTSCALISLVTLCWATWREQSKEEEEEEEKHQQKQ